MKHSHVIDKSIMRPLNISIVLFKYFCCLLLLLLTFNLAGRNVTTNAEDCPQSESILPCRCSLRGKELQIWCSHSNLPQVMDGIKAVERNIKTPIDELVLENNQLPALPGRFFGSLQIMRLMLRYNSIERLSNGWLNELENSLLEIYIVEPQLRSIPFESLNGMINMIAITIQSDELKHLPDFSGLLSLHYLSVQSGSLTDVQAHWFRHLAKVQNIHINGGPLLNRLESGLFDNLISLKNIDLSRNGINWIHIRAMTRLPNLMNLKLSYNQISDVGMMGRIVKDLDNLKKLRLDHNIISLIEDGSFVDLPYLAELHLNDNRITEIQYGAFLRTPMLKTIYLHNNHIRRIHPESFLQASGSGVETVYIYNNEIEHIGELRSLLDALPALKFLDISNNFLSDIKYGALRGHGTLEQLHLNNNLLRSIDRDALIAMPALRELRMRNNSLSDDQPMPFWNLPGLKGLDLSSNNFHKIDSYLLAGLPSLRRLDLSENRLMLLDPATFIHNPMLETLNISANELVNINPATFRNLDRLFEVDASYNKLTEIIPGLPKIVERVSVRGNSITNLPFSASKALNLPNLRMLDLSYNHLEHLPKYAFKGAPQLRVLSISNNHIRSLDDTAFIGAQRIEFLHMQENELTQIDERALLALSELRNLNLQGNKIVAITDNLFSNNSRLEQLDLSRNFVRTISPSAFESQGSLEYLDLSGNALGDMSVSLSNLNNLRDIDLSYNQISRVHADIVSAWRNVVEIRLSNNLIVELKHGTFRNLPKLQYLDLSGNEILSVEPGALKHLPDLQEFVLADNKLVDLKDHVFEDLPNLLASHFQYNSLRYISPESFYNSPSMVFLNLSSNNFRSLENVGLRSMRNLEVLDLSANGVRMVSTMPFKALNWLVELKMDNNQICKIQGAPFETMPRLRVLSMRNNRLRTIKEPIFRNLRGNIAILDVDGNPIHCSCEMQWLAVWLQETNFPYPGPKCHDGRLLRALRMDRQLCSTDNYAGYTNQRNNGASDNGAELENGSAVNHLPLLNDHGDVFQRELPDQLTDECEYADLSPGDRPLAGESEYFYDQYVDYTPGVTAVTNGNVTSTKLATNGVGQTFSVEPSTPVSNQRKKPAINQNANSGVNIKLNNTILNTKYFTKRPFNAPASSSPFTFFGYPIPSLSLGRFFGTAQRGRKDRGEQARRSGTLEPSYTTTGHATTGEMPATHRSQAPIYNIEDYQQHAQQHRGKVRMYHPNSAEFEKYLQQSKRSDRNTETLSKPESGQYEDVNARNRFVDMESEEIASNDMSGGFRTSFREPTTIERGGFRPILPNNMSVGGFMPVHYPSRSNHSEHATAIPSTTAIPTALTTAATAEIDSTTMSMESMLYKRAHANNDQRNYVPLNAITNKPSRNTLLHQLQPTSSSTTETRTYYVTEAPVENPTSALSSPKRTATVRTTTSAVTQLSSSATTTTTTQASATSDGKNSFETQYDEYDLEAQSVGMLKPPPLLPTTTVETILLIPPPEEHVAQIKRHSWVTPTNIDHESDTEDTEPDTREIVDEAPVPSRSEESSKQTPPRNGGAVVSNAGGSGRSTITKIYTSQNSNQHMPKAEEYFRQTPRTHETDFAPRTHEDNQENLNELANGEEQALEYPNQRDPNDVILGLQQQLVNDQADKSKQTIDMAERRDDMEWYYESFKKHQQLVGGSAGSSSSRHGSSSFNAAASSTCRTVEMALCENVLAALGLLSTILIWNTLC